MLHPCGRVISAGTLFCFLRHGGENQFHLSIIRDLQRGFAQLIWAKRGDTLVVEIHRQQAFAAHGKVSRLHSVRQRGAATAQVQLAGIRRIAAGIVHIGESEGHIPAAGQLEPGGRQAVEVAREVHQHLIIRLGTAREGVAQVGPQGLPRRYICPPAIFGVVRFRQPGRVILLHQVPGLLEPGLIVFIARVVELFQHQHIFFAGLRRQGVHIRLLNGICRYFAGLGRSPVPVCGRSVLAIEGFQHGFGRGHGLAPERPGAGGVIRLLQFLKRLHCLVKARGVDLGSGDQVGNGRL